MSGWFAKSPKKSKFKLPKEIVILSETPVYARNRQLQQALIAEQLQQQQQQQQAPPTETNIINNNGTRPPNQHQQEQPVRSNSVGGGVNPLSPTQTRSSQSRSVSRSSHLVAQQQQRARSKSASRRESSRSTTTTTSHGTSEERSTSPRRKSELSRSLSWRSTTSSKGGGNSSSPSSHLVAQQQQQRERSKSASRRESSRTSATNSAEVSAHSRKSDLSRSFSWRSTASGNGGDGIDGTATTTTPCSSSHSRRPSSDGLTRSMSGRSVGGTLTRSASGRRVGGMATSNTPPSKQQREGGGTPASSASTPRSTTSSSTTPTNSARARATPTSPIKQAKKPAKIVIRNGKTTEWHTTVLQQDWVKLERLLKSYDPITFKEAAETTIKKKDDKQAKKQQPQRKLRVMKYLPKLGGIGSTKSATNHTDNEDGDSNNNNQDEDEGARIISPLLQVDAHGRTPLHYACKEQQIPKKLLLRLIHSERTATSVSDQDGRLPLHIAILFQKDAAILDKIIRANPNALFTEDCLNQTPTVYAVRQAIHSSRRLVPGNAAPTTSAPSSAGAAGASNILTWQVPISMAQKEWQTMQTITWNKVKFVLETLETRRRPLTKRHTPEADLILEAVESLAPPLIVMTLLKLCSIKFLLPQPPQQQPNDATESVAMINQSNEIRCVKVLMSMFEFHYPLTIIQTLLKIMAKNMTPNIQATVRQGYVDHYLEGFIQRQQQQELQPSDAINAVMASLASNSGGGNGGAALSFRTELLETERLRQLGNTTIAASLACQEWWTKLRFLIKSCSPTLQDGDKLLEEYILHAALSVPETPPSLIELLIRLNPVARYEVDPLTGALPIHLACRFWSPAIPTTTTTGTHHKKIDEPSMEMVLNLLLADDFSLVWKRYKSRLPLHHAILAGKPWAELQTILALDNKTAHVRDPITKLYPFQLATTQADNNSRSSNSNSNKEQAFELQQLNVVYELLRTKPIAITPPPKLGDLNHLPSGVVLGPVAKHYIEWCYTYQRRSLGPGSWVVNAPRMKALQDAVCSGGVLPTMMEPWWVQMKFWLWLSYDKHGTVPGKPKGPATLPHQDEFLLHAALFNDETPPLVVDLILELYHGSVSMPIPGTDIYPLHIAAATPAYSPMPFEHIVSMGSSMEMLIIIHPHATRVKCYGRLPIHMAVAVGKTWNEIKPLVDQDPNVLCTRDPVSGLYPFQLLAARESSVPSPTLISRQTRLTDWNARTAARSGRGAAAVTKDCGTLIRGIQKDYHLRVLTSIFEVLRRNPNALSACVGAGRRNHRESWSLSLTKGVQSLLENPCK